MLRRGPPKSAVNTFATWKSAVRVRSPPLAKVQVTGLEYQYVGSSGDFMSRSIPRTRWSVVVAKVLMPSLAASERQAVNPKPDAAWSGASAAHGGGKHATELGKPGRR